MQQIENAVAPKKRTPATTKANTSKPRTTTTTGRVTKAKATTTTGKTNVKNVKKPRTKTEKLVDKVTGNAEKAVGEIEQKPGKKAAGTRKSQGTDSMTKRRARV